MCSSSEHQELVLDLGKKPGVRDLFAMSAAVGPYVTVARADLKTMPLVGTIGRAWHGIFVDRSRGSGKRYAAASAADHRVRPSGSGGMRAIGVATADACIVMRQIGGAPHNHGVNTNPSPACAVTCLERFVTSPERSVASMARSVTSLQTLCDVPGKLCDVPGTLSDLPWTSGVVLLCIFPR